MNLLSTTSTPYLASLLKESSESLAGGSIHPPHFCLKPFVNKAFGGFETASNRAFPSTLFFVKNFLLFINFRFLYSKNNPFYNCMRSKYNDMNSSYSWRKHSFNGMKGSFKDMNHSTNDNSPSLNGRNASTDWINLPTNCMSLQTSCIIRSIFTIGCLIICLSII